MEAFLKNDFFKKALSRFEGKSWWKKYLNFHQDVEIHQRTIYNLIQF